MIPQVLYIITEMRYGGLLSRGDWVFVTMDKDMAEQYLDKLSEECPDHYYQLHPYVKMGNTLN